MYSSITASATLNAYCDALKSGDYQTAYHQFSSGVQSQIAEAQFANLFSPDPVTSCMVSNVNDTAGTGSINFTYANGGSNIRDYTLINENGNWKIDSSRVQS